MTNDEHYEFSFGLFNPRGDMIKTSTQGFSPVPTGHTVRRVRRLVKKNPVAGSRKAFSTLYESWEEVE